MFESGRLRPVLWGIIGVCLVAGLVAVPIVGDGDRVRAGDGQWVGGVPSTTTLGGDVGGVEASASAPAGDEVDGGDGVPVDGSGGFGGGDAPPPGARTAPVAPSGFVTPSTAASSSTAPPTTAAPPEDLGPPGDPGPAKPPRAGAYRSKLTIGAETRDTTTTIEDRGTTGAETRQLVKIRGEGFDIDSDVAWRPDGVHVLSSVIVFGSNRGSCDWEPDTLQLRLPTAKGTTWESASTCSMTGIGPTPIVVSRKLTGKYLELRRVRVAGQVVDVWAIEATERIEAAGRVTDRKGTTLFSPKHGLSVSSSGTVTTSDGTKDYRSEIQNLDPE